MTNHAAPRAGRTVLFMLIVASLVLPALLAPPATATSPAPDETQSKTDCLGDVDLAMCVTSAFTITLTCRRLDAGHVGCDAPVTWVSEGHSTMRLPGETHRAPVAMLHWCQPNGHCSTAVQLWWNYYGPQGCYFGLLQPTVMPGCSETGTANLDPGPMPLDAGQCMDVTLSGSLRVDGYLSLNALVARVTVDDRALATADVQVTVSANVCN